VYLTAVATFEDEENLPGQRAISGFQNYYGVFPEIDHSEAFCGTSLGRHGNDLRVLKY
jgi:hypothetical protein